MDEAVVPEVFTVDYIGEAGRRSFFLQVRSVDSTRTMTLEKQQVSALAEKIAEMLLMLDPEDPVRQSAAGRDPLLDAIPMPGEWRVGTVGLGVDEVTGMFVLEIAPIESDVAELSGRPDDDVRVALPKERARAFVLHALAVVAEGRPECQLCGLPMDPEGHRCPATNGHHPR